MVSFHEDVLSGHGSEDRIAASIDTKERPRADQVMHDLQLDLSEEDGGTS